ncbi:hypothetical protein FOB84_16135 [Gordonia bronchialis]|uniref:hypothetical protein n=1 Tax=Gordonia bronchialis TaxID=2054 RepID=UPI00019BA3BB|nr:hypothetical protein [Gordonia bronchialis]MCC3323595.1 hypothetical protein [Gordonia bronchialis]QGS25436.1 hypothetical protein FOB84_16135 [Gordonia bronchialis]UAK38136.1 hypothetical protein K8O93_24480 [Gordonia bronchialis]
MITRDDREILRSLDVIDNCQPGRDLITWVGASPPQTVTRGSLGSPTRTRTWNA